MRTLRSGRHHVETQDTQDAHPRSLRSRVHKDDRTLETNPVRIRVTRSHDANGDIKPAVPQQVSAPIKTAKYNMQHNDNQQHIANEIDAIPSNETILLPSQWRLPRNRSIANELNPNIEFLYSRDLSHYEKYGHSLKSVKIRYNPRKFLNFKRLLYSGQEGKKAADEASALPNIKRDLEIQEILYKSIYSTKKEYNVSRTTPLLQDRKLFENTLARSSSAAFVNRNVLLTYPFEFRRWRQCPAQIRRTRVKAIYINETEIKTLYPSPYPEHVNREPIIHICENCLAYYSSRFQYYRHQQKCRTHENPPGTLIYRDGTLRLYEIDGRESSRYCRNLCLLSMLFLKSKTLFYEVDPFIFYVLYNGNQIVGYFSKEKLNSTSYNLSCILTLPMFRRQGFGNLLMEFSYLLSRREFKAGSPEKPLSDLGLLTYRYYWKSKVAEALLSLRDAVEGKRRVLGISLEELSNLTGMTTSDIVFGLEQLNALYRSEDESQFAIIISDWSYVEFVRDKWLQKMLWHIRPELLIWKPLIYGPSCGVNSVNNNNLDIANERARVPGASETHDAFNEQIRAMSTFMVDDIDDTRDTEDVAMEKLKERMCGSSMEVPQVSWKLCFEAPGVPATKHKALLPRQSPQPAMIAQLPNGDEAAADPEEVSEEPTIETVDNKDTDNDYDEAEAEADSESEDDDDEEL